MKIKLALLLILTSFISRAQYTKIPDNNFETKLIALGLDSGVADGKVATANIVNVEELYVANLNITDLTGIEDFKNLLSLKCSSNKLKSLDVSKNTMLLYLDCGSNELSSLKMTNNVVMGGLYCASNRLINLDLSNNIGLTNIDCSYNKLVTIDVSKNIKLQKLRISFNVIASVDVSKNSDLKDLDCGHNKLTSLEVSKNLKLQTISCEENQITSLNVSKNPELYSLVCMFNDLKSLDIKNGSPNFHLEAIRNPNLTCIAVDNVEVAIADKSWGKDKQMNFSLNCNDDVGTGGDRQTINVPNNSPGK